MSRLNEHRQVIQFARAIAVVAVALALTLGCTSSKKSELTLEQRIVDWNTTVDNAISDARRAEKVKQIGRQLMELKSSMSTEFAEMNRQAAELNASYETTTDEAMQFFEQFEKRRKAALAQYRDLVFAMRAEVNAEEWEALID